MTTRKIALHESEKSQQMMMQAWTLNLMLDKDKKRLGRSERMVCNRITVDQKLLCKRYRKKLHESKIKFARITQNKQMEQELIEERVSFNTDVGNEIEKDEMLRKVWRAGSEKFLDNRRKQEILKSRLLIRMGSTDSMESVDVKPSTAQGTRRPTTAVSIASPSFIKRPFTAIESHLRRPLKDVNETNEDEEEDDEVFERASIECDDKTRHKDSVVPKPSRPKTAFVKHLTTATPMATMSARATPAGVRATQMANSMRSNTAETPRNIFIEEKKPTLLDFHRNRLREAKYEDKIKEFGKSISSMCDSTHHMSDYYTLRLIKESEEQNSQKIVSFAHLATGAVPPDEFKKWSGDTRLKAITVKSLDYDFDRRPSTFFHSSVF